MSNIDFSGPNPGSVPTTIFTDTTDIAAQVQTTYANINHVATYLQSARITCQQLLSDAEAKIGPFSLVVTSDADDVKLVQAIAQEWPSVLGTPPNYVSYGYYKYLENVDTRSAHYIRNRYEEAARDVTGTDAIEIVQLMELFLNEVNLATEFTAQYVGNLDDTSEHRAIENIQDWAQSAVTHAGKLGRILQATDASRQFPQADVDAISTTDARNSQAVFKINLNQLNNDLIYNLNFLRKMFQTHASTFYHNVLGPALKFRIEVARNISPIMRGRVGNEANAARDVTDRNLVLVLADQSRRMINFEDKMKEIEINIPMRDYYRTYINQLSSKGITTQKGSLGTMSTTSNTAKTDAYFQQLATQSQATPNFTSPHGSLDGTLAPDAHPQYLLNSGGTITGNMAMVNGVKIDGIVPSLHAHTGHDGTVNIHGSDIIGGTLPPGAVDSSQAPNKPRNITIVNQATRMTTPGTRVVDVTIGWDGDAGDTFNVQISPII